MSVRWSATACPTAVGNSANGVKIQPKEDRYPCSRFKRFRTGELSRLSLPPAVSVVKLVVTVKGSS